MKKIMALVLLLYSYTVVAQWGVRVPQEEYVFANVHLDYPETLNPDKKKRGVNYVIEVGISTYINNFVGVEAKINYEAFPSLFGGYDGFGAGFGFKMVSGLYEQFNYYVGWKASKIYRNGPKGRTYRWNPALEATFSVDVTDDFYVGLRYVLEHAYDQEIFDWTVENRNSVYLTLGIKLGNL